MVVGQIMSFYMIKIPLVYGKWAVSQLLKVRERACRSKLGYFSISSIFYLIMLYVIYRWLVYCLFYFSKTVLVGLNLCCFQMLFFPPTQEKEDHSLTKHLYYSQLFLWIFLLNSLLKVTNFYMLPSLVCFSIVVFYCNKILVVIVQWVRVF